MIDLDALERLASTATAGPWWIDSHGHEMVNPESMELVFRTDNSMGELARNEETGNLSRWPNDNDATFIASFNPDVAIELITRLRQAEKDAARYRWLRESASTEDHGGFAYNFRVVDAIRYMPGAAPNETMDIDDAIDEAMQSSGDDK